MDFKAFDRSKLDEYARQAKELYGNLPEYKEMEEKQKNRTDFICNFATEIIQLDYV